ncbi:MAG: ABC transporter ATP-binding protein [Alphaproteobacteria bacterium]|nr:ABC transporter ATP-binding protein [Alphaproteobacteria bacterium]
MAQPETIIEVTGLRTQFGRSVIHDDLDFTVRRGEVMGVVGGSGTGKSVLLKEIIGLITPAAGTIRVLGGDVLNDEAAMQRARESWGVLFQDGALFSSLTVAENIQVPMRERGGLSQTLMDDLARVKLALVGLPADAGPKFPSELSGGMRKRAGLARALAQDPALLFLDEPTAGLDPIGAADFDTLIRNLQQSLGLTVVMVTHDLDSLVAVTDRISALVDKKVVVGTIAELMEQDHPWLRSYFHGARARQVAGMAAPNVEKR